MTLASYLVGCLIAFLLHEAGHVAMALERGKGCERGRPLPGLESTDYRRDTSGHPFPRSYQADPFALRPFAARSQPAALPRRAR
jgi:hypothetical protein